MYCLDNEQTHFRTNFPVHFINFIKRNLANRRRVANIAHVHKGQGAAVWQINLYYIIRIVQWGAVAKRLECATDDRVLIGSNPAEAVRKVLQFHLPHFASVFRKRRLKAVGPFLPCAIIIINRSEVKHLTKGVNVSPVVDSVILHGQ